MASEFRKRHRLGNRAEYQTRPATELKVMGMEDIASKINPNNGRLDVALQREPLRGMFGLWITLRVSVNDERYLCRGKPIEFVPVTSDVPIGERLEPTLWLKNEVLQLIADECWRIGIKPTDSTDNAGALSATRAHLKDMQEIALPFIKLHTQPMPVREVHALEEGTIRDLKYVLEALRACQDEMAVANAGNPITAPMRMNEAAQETVVRLLQ